jgi:hypothetical protein
MMPAFSRIQGKQEPAYLFLSPFSLLSEQKGSLALETAILILYDKY